MKCYAYELHENLTKCNRKKMQFSLVTCFKLSVTESHYGISFVVVVAFNLVLHLI